MDRCGCRSPSATGGSRDGWGRQGAALVRQRQIRRPNGNRGPRIGSRDRRLSRRVETIASDLTHGARRGAANRGNESAVNQKLLHPFGQTHTFALGTRPTHHGGQKLGVPHQVRHHVGLQRGRDLAKQLTHGFRAAACRDQRAGPCVASGDEGLGPSTDGRAGDRQVEIKDRTGALNKLVHSSSALRRLKLDHLVQIGAKVVHLHLIDNALVEHPFGQRDPVLRSGQRFEHAVVKRARAERSRHAAARLGGRPLQNRRLQTRHGLRLEVRGCVFNDFQQVVQRSDRRFIAAAQSTRNRRRRAFGAKHAATVRGNDRVHQVVETELRLHFGRSALVCGARFAQQHVRLLRIQKVCSQRGKSIEQVFVLLDPTCQRIRIDLTSFRVERGGAGVPQDLLRHTAERADRLFCAFQTFARCKIADFVNLEHAQIRRIIAALQQAAGQKLRRDALGARALGCQRVPRKGSGKGVV